MEKSFTNIDDLAQFIFINNYDDHKIDMEISQGVTNTKDLFFVCIELLVTGMKILYGDENNKVSLDTITQEQLTFLKNKLILAKIDFEIDMIDSADILIEVNSDDGSTKYKFKNEDANNQILQSLLIDIHDLPNDLPLHDYCFNLNVNNKIYFIRFKLVLPKAD